MVTSRISFLSSAPCFVLSPLLLLLAGGCHTVDPVTVYPSFTTSPELVAQAPSDIAVLPVENGTRDPATDRHLGFMRHEVIRQLVDRKYGPLRAAYVDAGLRSNQVAKPENSVLDPIWLQSAVGHSSEDATFALRVDRWDESQLLVNRRAYFQFQAALIGKEGKQLWYGTLSGDIKAGGAGAAPRDREYMARSCIELAVRELLLRLPVHANR